MEHLLGQQPHRRAGTAGPRVLRQRGRRLRGPPAAGRAADPRAIHLVEHHGDRGALGAGVLARRWQDLGEELDHDHDPRELGRAGPSALPPGR